LNSAPAPAGPEWLAAIVSGDPIRPIYGVLLGWSTVPGAVSYRVYRGEVGQVAAVPVHLTVSAADAAAAGQSPAGTLALMVDPYFPITKIASPIYWVDAIFANGSMSGLSPNATLSPPSILGPPQFGPKNLTAMIGPQMTLPGDPQTSQERHVELGSNLPRAL
jgi:hypothetical protein